MKRLHSTALVLLFTALLAAPLGGKAAAAAKSRHDSVREAFELMQRSEKHAD